MSLTVVPIPPPDFWVKLGPSRPWQQQHPGIGQCRYRTSFRRHVGRDINIVFIADHSIVHRHFYRLVCLFFIIIIANLTSLSSIDFNMVLCGRVVLVVICFTHFRLQIPRMRGRHVWVSGDHHALHCVVGHHRLLAHGEVG